MSYRELLKEMLIDEEGLRYEPYRCPAGKLTIGVGHNMDANPLPKGMQDELRQNGKLSLQSILQLLEKDIDYAELDARKLFDGFNDFSVNRKAAVVDLLFNMGLGTFRKFVTTIASIRHGNWDAAAAGLTNSKWFKQVGHRGPKIVALIKNG